MTAPDHMTKPLENYLHERGHPYMVLVAEGGNGDIDWRHRAVCLRLGLGELDRPACIAVLLPQFRGLVPPILRDAAGLDLVLLFLRVPLLRRGDQAGIDDLPRHRDVAGVPQHRVKAFEQRLNRSSLGQPFAEQPDRARIRNPVRKSKAEEAHERQPVIDQELGALVRQVVGGLDHQHLEHHHRVVGRSAAVGSARIGQRLFQIRPERLEIDNPPIGLELITKIAQPPKPVVDIKEPRCSPHRNPPSPRMDGWNHKPGEMARLIEASTLSEGPSGLLGRDDAAPGGEAFQHIARQRGQDDVVFDTAGLPGVGTGTVPTDTLRSNEG